MNDALYQAKREYDKALEAKNKAMLAILNANRDKFHADPAWQELYYCHPVAKYATKLQKLLGDFQAAHGEDQSLTASVTAATKAATTVLEAKVYAEAQKTERRTLGCKSDRARRAANEWLDKNDQMRAAVTEVANGFRDKLEAQFKSYYRGIVEQWQKFCQDQPGRTCPYTFWPLESNVGRFTYQFNHHIIGIVSKFLDADHRPSAELLAMTDPNDRRHEQLRYTLKPNWEKMVETISREEAEAAIQGFIYKMSAKLTGIIDGKGDFEQVSVHGSLGQNTLQFVFADGSCFTLTNDIIIKRSCLGKVHNQYPTRFSNVTLRGTTGMKGISESWMKKNFK